MFLFTNMLISLVFRSKISSIYSFFFSLITSMVFVFQLFLITFPIQCDRLIRVKKVTYYIHVVG